MQRAVCASGVAHLLPRLVGTDSFAAKALLSPFEDALIPGAQDGNRRGARVFPL